MFRNLNWLFDLPKAKDENEDTIHIDRIDELLKMAFYSVAKEKNAFLIPEGEKTDPGEDATPFERKLFEKFKLEVYSGMELKEMILGGA